MFPRSLIVLTIVLVFPGVVVAQGEIVIRPHDLRALAEGFGGNQVVSLTLPLRASCYGMAGDRYRLEALMQMLEDRASVKEVAELIQTHVLGDEHDKSRWTELRGGILWVSASMAAQQRIARLIARLEEHFLRTVRVEIHLLPGSALKEAPSAVFDAEAADQILESHSPLCTAEAVLRLGQQGRIIAARRELFLRNYGVEVAQKARISDPLVSALLEGLELGVLVRPTCDGRYMLRAQGRFCLQDGDCQIVPHSTAVVGRMQFPRARSTVSGGAALIESGGGILLGHTGPVGSLWMVRAHAPAGTPADEDEGPGIISIGSLTTPPLELEAPEVIGPLASGTHLRRDEWEDKEALEAPLLMSVLARVTGIPERKLGFLDGRVLVEDSERAGVILEALRPLCERALRNVSLELRFGVADDKDVRSLLARPAEEIAGELQHAALGAARIGDNLLLVGGRESLYLKDFDIELAEGAVISDPIPDTLFHGFAFCARTSLTAAGSLQLAGDLTFQHVLSEDQRFDPGLEDVGALDTPVAVHVTGLPRVLLANGQWSLLRAAPFVGTRKTLIAMVRARF